MPIFLAVLGLVGLIGALVFEGASDKIFVSLIGLALLPILAKIIK